MICTPYELLGDWAMLQNEILDEIYKVREEHAKSFNYDLDAMFADWQKKQAEGGRKIVSLVVKAHSNSTFWTHPKRLRPFQLIE